MKLSGEIILIKGFPRDKKIKCLGYYICQQNRYIVTNDLTQLSKDDVDFELKLDGKSKDFTEKLSN